MRDNHVAIPDFILDPAFVSTPRHLLEAPDQPLALEAGQPLDPDRRAQ